MQEPAPRRQLLNKALGPLHLPQQPGGMGVVGVEGGGGGGSGDRGDNDHKPAGGGVKGEVTNNQKEFQVHCKLQNQRAEWMYVYMCIGEMCIHVDTLHSYRVGRMYVHVHGFIWGGGESPPPLDFTPSK